MTRFFAWGRRGVLVGIALMLAGCSWSGADGSRRYVVFGIGVVRVNEWSGPGGLSGEAGVDPVRVSRIETAGVLVSSGPVLRGVLIGTIQRQQVEVDPRSDVIVEAISGGSRGFVVNVFPVRVGDAGDVERMQSLRAEAGSGAGESDQTKGGGR